MKFLIVALALCATAYAALPSSEYLPPLEDASPAESNVDLQSLETSPLAEDGYRYKAVKRYRLRHRRDVSELPSNEYLPPAAETKVQEVVVEAAPVVDIPVVAAASEDSAVLADDGYRYKTVKRYRIRRRRDVNELPTNEYLPPAEETRVEEVAVAAPVEAPVVAASQESAVLADDGYRYRTVKRYRIRRRRDVNELPSNEYLPPAEETKVEEVVVEAPVEAPVVAASQESAVLADDGYRYRTVKRYRIRRRRDVNELPSNEYLPPAEETRVEEVAVEAPVEAPVVAASQESAVLADDGYRYRTVKRYRIRRRRDVNELPSNEYLPPAEETRVEEIAVEAPVEAPVVAASQESAVLADDGYRYRTVKRYRIRRRRDVNELPSNDYLPPAEETRVEEVAVEAPVEAPVVAASQESAVLADDGYRYRTVKRYRIRRRRDVNELPSNEYLPPAEETKVEEVAVEAPVEAPVVAASQESAVLADDGYRYRTVKRYRIRRRRDVNELPSNEYLPPAEETKVEEVALEAPVEAPVVAASQESAVLADDGYRYRTVKRYRIRRRRDVNELPAYDYLPPAQESKVEEVAIEAPAPVLAPAPVEAPVVAAASEESAVRAEDGYRYKTVRRVVYRHRK